MTDFNGLGLAMILNALDKVQDQLIKRVEDKYKDDIEVSEDALDNLIENLRYDRSFSNAKYACEEFLDAAEARKNRDTEIARIDYFFQDINRILKNEKKCFECSDWVPADKISLHEGKDWCVDCIKEAKEEAAKDEILKGACLDITI